MLKADFYEKIAKALGLDAAALKAAHEDKEEKDFPIPEDIHAFTQAQLDTRDKNKKDEGIKVGKELAVKDIKQEAGLDFEGKDPKTLIEKLTEKVGKDAATPLDEKLKERDKTIGQLRESIKAKEAEFTNLQQTVQRNTTRTQVLSWTLDKKPDHFTNDEWVDLIMNGTEVFEENGQQFVKRGGEVVKDPKEFKPIPAKDYLASYIEERKWGKVVETQDTGGRGGGNKTGGSGNNGAVRNMREAQEYLKANNIHPNSQQAQEFVSAQSKGKPDFFKETA